MDGVHRLLPVGGFGTAQARGGAMPSWKPIRAQTRWIIFFVLNSESLSEGQVNWSIKNAWLIAGNFPNCKLWRIGPFMRVHRFAPVRKALSYLLAHSLSGVENSCVLISKSHLTRAFDSYWVNNSTFRKMYYFFLAAGITWEFFGRIPALLQIHIVFTLRPKKDIYRKRLKKLLKLTRLRARQRMFSSVLLSF